jgi:hypothetical protein
MLPLTIEQQMTTPPLIPPKVQPGILTSQADIRGGAEEVRTDFLMLILGRE